MDADLIRRLGERATGPIRYGIDDCVPWAADYIKARTGVDPIADLRPLPYLTRAGRDAYATDRGGLARAIIKGVQRRATFSRTAPDSVTGDALGLAYLHGQWTLALHAGNGWWLTRCDGGLMAFDGKEVRRAWVWE